MVAADHFRAFGLPERFEIDLADLERRYLARSRELHPDRHAGSSRDRVEAAAAMADLNEAYKVLRDDFRRTEHLLQRRGIETTEAESQDHLATVDAGLLLQVLELREALADARARRDAARIDELAAEVRGRSDEAWRVIRAAWTKVEAGSTPGDFGEIAAHLTALRYYRRFLDEIAAIEED
jgi:molecular chaperone HscB